MAHENNAGVLELVQLALKVVSYTAKNSTCTHDQLAVSMCVNGPTCINSFAVLASVSVNNNNSWLYLL